MTGLLRPAAGAVSFLTRAPVGRLVGVEAADVRRGAWLFPLVGGIVGGASGLLADLTAEWLPALAAGGLAVAAAALLTGALHLDALADTADSLGATTRERALEIMRDHSIGTFGAVALIVVCVVDAAIFGALAQTDDAAAIGLAAGAAGRAAMLPQALALPYARAGDGQGVLLSGIGFGTVVLGFAVAVLLAFPAGVAGVCALCGGALASLVLGLGAWHRFGAVTGDVLGATAKLAETTALLAAAVALS